MSNERYLMMESDIKNLSFQLESITKSKYDSDRHISTPSSSIRILLRNYFTLSMEKASLNIQGANVFL